MDTYAGKTPLTQKHAVTHTRVTTELCEQSHQMVCSTREREIIEYLVLFRLIDVDMHINMIQHDGVKYKY